MDDSSASRDALRSTLLSFERELRVGTISAADLAARPDVVSAFRPRKVPTIGVRVLQRFAMKAGRLDFESGYLAAVHKARQDMLAPGGDAPPRFLIRVDEYPDCKAFDDGPERWRRASRAFHETLHAEGVPYLMAIVPQYTHCPYDPNETGGRPLDDEDHVLIEQMGRENVTFAQHGSTHRTRYRNARRRSELCGIDADRLETLIADGRDRLAEVGVFPRIFVPPFNRFDARQFSDLARHFDVIGGGPENVPLFGFQGGPVWRGRAVYLPCYPPVYAAARQLPPVIDTLVAMGIGTWVPIVLHVSWEMGDLSSLAALARKIAPYAASWGSFLDAVDATREPVPAQSPDRPGST